MAKIKIIILLITYSIICNSIYQTNDYNIVSIPENKVITEELTLEEIPKKEIIIEQPIIKNTSIGSLIIEKINLNKPLYPINDKKNNDAIITDIKISQADTAHLKESNILIANLDGLTIDDGVSAEIMAHGVMREFELDHGIDFPRMIIGIITDMRYQGTGENKLYRNLMVVGKVKEHGNLVVGYAGDASFKDEVVELINKFIEENK